MLEKTPEAWRTKEVRSVAIEAPWLWPVNGFLAGGLRGLWGVPARNALFVGRGRAIRRYLRPASEDDGE